MLPFVKMHGLGNDFIVVDGLDADVDAIWLRGRAQELCARHEGVGADGVLLLTPGREGDLALTVFNADGSRAEMCGNGLRCVALLAHDRGRSRNGEVLVETGAGLLRVWVLEGEKEGTSARVLTELGVPRILRRPRSGEEPGGVKDLLEAADRIFEVSRVDLGNPHCVVFLDPRRDGPVARFPVSTFGPALERHLAFPEGTNVEFVEILTPDRLLQRTWERGVGETRACGTGAAAAAAAHLDRQRRFGGEVVVVLPGGEVRVSWKGEDETILLEGPARRVYDGVLPVSGATGLGMERLIERGRS